MSMLTTVSGDKAFLHWLYEPSRDKRIEIHSAGAPKMTVKGKPPMWESSPNDHRREKQSLEQYMCVYYRGNKIIK